MWQTAAARLLAGLLYFATTGLLAAVSYPEGHDAVQACTAQLLNTQDSIYSGNPVNLKQTCPRLSARRNQPVFAQLQPPLENETSFSQLYDVHRILETFAHKPNAYAGQLDHAALDQLLREIYQPPVKPEAQAGMLQKFLDWLEALLDNMLQSEESDTRKLLQEGEFENLKNIVIVILIVIILYIIVNELYAANLLGLFRRRERRQQTEAAPVPDTATAALQGLKQIRDLPLGRQVPALLRYAIQQLVARQILPPQYSLSNQEFLALLNKRYPMLTRDFESLVNAGDRVVYGNKSLTADVISRLYENVNTIEQADTRKSP